MAYRPLRGSFRLAPLITAIGMSILLSNFVQVTQGPRNKSIPPHGHDASMIRRRHLGLAQADHHRRHHRRRCWPPSGTSSITTPLGRAPARREQDRKMAALLGINVDRTISITFVMGAALAAVAGTMYMMYYGVISFTDGFVPGVKAFTAAVLGGIGSLPGAVLGGLLIGLIEALWSAYFTIDYKDVATFSILAIVLIFKPSRHPRTPRSREGLTQCRTISIRPGRPNPNLTAYALRESRFSPVSSPSACSSFIGLETDAEHPQRADRRAALGAHARSSSSSLVVVGRFLDDHGHPGLVAARSAAASCRRRRAAGPLLQEELHRDDRSSALFLYPPIVRQASSACRAR